MLVSGTINFFPYHSPFVYLKVFILLSRLCCTIFANDIHGKTDKYFVQQLRQIVCAWAYHRPTRVCLNLQLYYLSRQHQKSDSYHRCAWLEWKCEALVMHGEVKNSYEHNVVVMNLLLSPKPAEDVILIVQTVNELQRSRNS